MDERRERKKNNNEKERTRKKKKSRSEKGDDTGWKGVKAREDRMKRGRKVRIKGDTNSSYRNGGRGWIDRKKREREREIR